MNLTSLASGFLFGFIYLAYPLCSRLPASSGIPFDNIETSDKSGISIAALCSFEHCPQFGFVPICVTIENASNSPGEWTFTYRSTFDYKTSIVHRTVHSVPPGMKNGFWDFLPLPKTIGENLFFREITVSISGPGVVSDKVRCHYTGYTSKWPTCFIGISESLAAPVWSILQKNLEEGSVSNSKENSTAPLATRRVRHVSSKRSLNGVRLDLYSLPADIRAFSSLGALWVTDRDWLDISESLRQTLRNWLSMGGHLFLLTDMQGLKPLPALSEIAPDTETQNIGFGRVTILRSEGRKLDAEDTTRRILDLDTEPISHFKSDYSDDWPMFDSVKYARMSAGWIIAFVCLFGLVIGPVNLWVIAPPRKRHRLFWSVPLISILSAVVIGVFITYLDGFGGVGRRFGALLFMTGEKRSVLIQEQASRAAFLFSRIFQLDPKTTFAHINEDNRNVRRYERSGFYLSGDWFSSRNRQAHILKAIEPTRAGIQVLELTEREAAVLSTISVPLENFFFIGTDGAYWHASILKTGETTALKQSSREKYEKWWKAAASDASAHLRAQLFQTMARKGYFYAESTKGESLLTDTLSSIQWEKNQVLILGPWEEAKP